MMNKKTNKATTGPGSGRGGAREGAGRKTLMGERKESLTVSLTPTLISFLNSGDRTPTAHIETTLRRTQAFKDWLSGQ